MSGLKGNGSVPSLPPPQPKSPPELYGRRRELAKVQMLEREIGFLEEELKSIEGLQLASRSCKEVADFVIGNPDPLIPTTKKVSRSCRFWKWLCGGISCFKVSWICCCSCPSGLKMPSCCCCCCNCINNTCNFCGNPWADCCRLPKCRCLSCQCSRMSRCTTNCCSSIPQCPSCQTCSCTSCTCYPKCLKLKNETVSHLFFSCVFSWSIWRVIQAKTKWHKTDFVSDNIKQWSTDHITRRSLEQLLMKLSLVSALYFI